MFYTQISFWGGCLSEQLRSGLQAEVPWLWGINGAAAVLGSVASVVIAMIAGIRAAMICGGASYLLLALIAHKLGQHRACGARG